MGSSLRGLWREAAPVVALLGVALLLGWLAPRPGLFATKTLLVLALAGLAWGQWERGQRSARLVARFLAALRHRDLQQSFRPAPGSGPGLAELGTALDAAMRRLRDERAGGEAERRFAAALLDEAPTPLLAIAGDDTVHLANKAARRLFGRDEGRRLDAFGRYGAEFAAALADAVPGRRTATRLLRDGVAERAVLLAAAAERNGRPWRIVSVNVIQRELDAAELATQVDLVRVLTHEIMNSLTPVSSLAASAAELIAQAGSDPEALADAQGAVAALARRAAGIADFVAGYRSFSQAPELNRARFAARPWVDELARLFAATPAAAGVAFAATLDPERLVVDGDPGLLAQVVLNLLKNAGEAAAGAPGPQVALAVREDASGRVRLAVEDNGPGVPPALRDEVFLPFFTTKRQGTGVGLSFARQVALLHGGSIRVEAAALGGARFEIVL